MTRANVTNDAESRRLAASAVMPRRTLLRRGLRAGLGLAAAAALALRARPGGTTAAASIPPNCIYVCCDGTCDSWKMCLRCVRWPKSTTAPSVATS